MNLNILEDEPVTVVRISNDGEKITVATFPDIEDQLIRPPRFLTSYSSSNKFYIYLVNDLDGKVFRAEWPLIS